MGEDSVESQGREIGQSGYWVLVCPYCGYEVVDIDPEIAEEMLEFHIYYTHVKSRGGET